MASARSIYQPQGWSQANQRRGQTFTDQHGRDYFANIEVKTGDTVGLFEPQFTAPLMPDQKYIERVPKRPYDVFINYKRWKADIRGADRDWNREGRQLMRKMRGKAYDPNEEFGEDVLDIIGEPPQAIEPVIAAEQENSWILGRVKKADKRLLKYFQPEQLDEDVVREHEEDFRDEPRKKPRPAAEEDALAGIPSQKDDWDEEYVRRTGKPDPDDLDEEYDPGSSGRHRQPVRSARPEPRAQRRGTGRGKGKPPSTPPELKGKRERYPKGHPRAGQFVPLERSA